jgi:hypothetical protein
MKAFVLLLLFVVSTASCQNTDDVQSVTLQDLELQFEAIQELVSQSNCSENSQCSYLAYGSKACGGPQGYLVFSSDIDVNKLEVMVTKYSEDENTYNKQNGIISDCSFPLPPENLTCKDGKCVILE